MPIPRPVTKTIISTTQWGIPITDAVNKAADVDIPALQAFMAANTPTPWVDVTFENGWTNFGSPYQGLQYRKVGDTVTIRGMVKGGASGTRIFTLPAGFLPPLAVRFVTVNTGTTIGYIQISGTTAAVAHVAGAVGDVVINASFSTV